MSLDPLFLNTLPLLDADSNKGSASVATVVWQGYVLPKWLFYCPHKKDNFVSPAAAFKPVAALAGSPWQTMTAPSQTLQAKTFVIERSIFLYGLAEIDVIAQIAWLKQRGINVYLCVNTENGNEFISCQEENELYSYVEKLGQFNSATDYDVLAQQHQLVRDKTAVLNLKRSREFYACLHQQRRHLLPYDPFSRDDRRRIYDASAYTVHIPSIIKQDDSFISTSIPITNGDDLIQTLQQRIRDIAECDFNVEEFLKKTLEENPKEIVRLLKPSRHEEYFINNPDDESSELNALLSDLNIKREQRNITDNWFNYLMDADFKDLFKKIFNLIPSTFCQSVRLSRCSKDIKALFSVFLSEVFQENNALFVTPLELKNYIIRCALKKAIQDNPIHSYKLLAAFSHLIDAQLTMDLFKEFPQLQDITMPFCYAQIGLMDITDVAYYIALRHCLTIWNLPLEKINFIADDDVRQLTMAYPELEQRFSELLSYLPKKYLPKSLLRAFPHKEELIFTAWIKVSPPTNYQELESAVLMFPNRAGYLLERYRDFYTEVSANASDQLCSFLKVIMKVGSAASSCAALFTEELIQAHFVEYLLCNPPDLTQRLTSSLVQSIEPFRWPSIFEKNPQIVDAYIAAKMPVIQEFSTIATIPDKAILRKIADYSISHAHDPDNFLWYLSWFPERVRPILDNEAQLPSTISLTDSMGKAPLLDIVLTLFERYPERISLKLDPNPFYRHSHVAFWHHSRVHQVVTAKTSADSIKRLYNNMPYCQQRFAETLCLDERIRFTPGEISDYIEKIRRLIITKKTDATALETITTVANYINLPIPFDPYSFDFLRALRSMLEAVLSFFIKSYNFIQTPSVATPQQSYDFTHCTIVSIGKLTDELIIDFSQFPNITQLRIHSADISADKLNAFFDKVAKSCRQLTHVVLPETLEKETRHLTYCLAYLKRATGNASSPDTRTLYIANNRLASSTVSSKEPSHFTMRPAAELLNARGKVQHRIRTGIIDFSDDFSKHFYRKVTLTSIELPSTLTDDFIAHCKKQNDNNYYYHFKLNITPGNPVRLCSVDAQETVLALRAQDASLELFRGDDDFFYVHTDKACQVEYVLQTDSVATMDNTTLNVFDEETQHILNGFLRSPQFTQVSFERQCKKPEESYTEWFERLYRCPGGACDERCYGVWYQFFKHPSLRERARLVFIDNDHIRLEVKNRNNQWRQIELGGKTSKKSYDNSIPTGTSLPLSKTAITPGKKVPASRTGKIANPTEPSFQASSSRASFMPSPLAALSSSVTPGSLLQSLATAKKNTASVHYAALKALVKKQQHPKDIENIADVFSVQQSPILLIHSDSQHLIYEFLRQARLQQHPVFLLNSPGQVQVAREQIHLETPLPSISTHDALDLFLAEHQNNPHAMLLIDWGAFNPEQHVSLNTVLDRNATLYGKLISCKVYSICAKVPKDSSFRSRHKEAFNPQLPAKEITSHEHTVIHDLLGLANWQEALFGDVLLIENKPSWQHPLLFEQNSDVPTTFILKNIPKSAIAEVEVILTQAKAQGYFTYQHRKIVIPSNVDFKIDNRPFDFSSFAAIHSCYNVSATAVPTDAVLINTALFDYLLTGKTISQGGYSTTSGLLAQFSGKELSLYLTTELSVHQWYCLLYHATLHKVALQLYCASGVKTPHEIKQVPLSIADPLVVKDEDLQPFVILSNAPQEIMKTVEATHTFAIEDYNYQDIVSAIRYVYADQQFKDFEEITSDIITALQNSEKIVLYGEFSTSLLYALQPLLYAQCQPVKPWPGTLLLIVDDQHSPDLSFLPPSRVIHQKVTAIKKVNPTVVYKETANTQIDLEYTAAKTKRFAEKRCHAIIETIEKYAITHLQGDTGSGKTFLMKEVFENHSDFKSFFDLEAWLQPAVDDCTKVLFWDDVHLCDKHLTMLLPLLTNDNPEILYRGKIYPLDKNKHRVVFASTTTPRSNSKVTQKLLTHPGIPQIQLDQLPSYFVYERLLKPIYHRFNRSMSEERFKKWCNEFITIYYQHRQENIINICVQGLQNWVLQYVLQYWQENQYDFFSKDKNRKQSSRSSHCVITPSLKPIKKHLCISIEEHKRRFLTNSPFTGGLNGCLLEGKPGIGKSELVRYCLQRSGYKEVAPGEKTSQECAAYIKVDAGLPPAVLKTYIRQAFNQGQIVWLDEINSIIETIDPQQNENLQRWMKAFLSGLDPDTQKPAEKPGFMLMVTANSIGKKGRSLLGPSIRGHLRKYDIPDPNEADFLTLCQKKLPDLSANAQEELARDLHYLCQEEPDLTLREIAPQLNQYGEIYRQPYEQDNAPYPLNNCLSG